MSYLLSVDEALQHYASTDPTMHRLVEAAVSAEPGLTLPQPKAETEYFSTLIRSVVGQQISTTAAASVFARVTSTVTLTPQALAAASETTLRECGLSRQKVRYIQALAASWESLETHTFAVATDTDICQRLTACYGIGVWTAEMFLMFAMARPDIFSIGDLGLRQQVAKHYGLEAADHTAIRSVTEAWSPHRTIASLALWYELDNGPVLF